MFGCLIIKGDFLRYFGRRMRKTLLIIILFSWFSEGFTQSMGNNSFSQLDIPFGARFTALGGVTLAIKDRDVFSAAINPSLLDTNHHNKTFANYANYIADMNFGMAGYARSFDKYGNFIATVKYFNYGKFKETDYIGNEIGSFSASDYMLGIGWSKQVDTSVMFGAALNFLYSVYDKNTAFGISTDIAATYHKPGSNFVATAVLKNIGYQIKSYVPGNRGRLPFDIQLALSQKLKHAPIRFHVAFDRLTKWDLTYTDPTYKPEIDPATGEEILVDTNRFFYKVKVFSGKLMRHITPGAEILLGKNFYFDIGFNFRRREELKYTEKRGLAGFNFGAGMFIKRMSFALAFSKYHLSSNVVQFNFAYAF